MMNPGPVESVDLTNCDREPIHIPGSIQPHGFLLAVDDQLVVRVASENTDALVGTPASALLDTRLQSAHVGAAAMVALARVIDGTQPSDVNPFPITANGQTYDGVVHLSGGLWIVEGEPAPEPSGAPHAFLSGSQRALERLQGVRTIDECCAAAADGVRRLTGFDRVMAYRFHSDASGEVMAEARAHHLEPYLGLRYPATDIPAQARRLYSLNLLRTIADAQYEPVALTPARNPVTDQPLDLSHAVLRSVSPIHREYLANIGVAASMSISIMVDGALWGLIACHHMTPRQVPYDIRVTCHLLGRVLGVQLSRAITHERAAYRERARQLRSSLLAQADLGDIVGELSRPHANLLDLIEADGAAVTMDSRITLLGDTPPRDVVARIVDWLRDDQGLHGCYATHELPRHFPAIDDHRGAASGLLAIDYHAARNGYVLWFRGEATKAVRWAGDPRKAVTAGPLGARLTPRGSFAEWTQTVEGTSTEWHPGNEEVALDLRHDLTALALRKTSESERMRELFLGVLGHDLRNPLEAITMATELLQAGATPADTARITERLAASSQRMRQLVDHLLDFTRIRSGMGLSIVRRPTNLHVLVHRIVEEIQLASPGMEVELSMTGAATCHVDPDRIEQVLSNLLSNARHHGHPAHPIHLRIARTHDGQAVVECHNHGDPIPADMLPRLFLPYTGSSRSNRRKRSGGLGLGLYITHEIIAAHKGRIDVDSTADRGTTFRISLPVTPPDGGDDD